MVDCVESITMRLLYVQNEVQKKRRVFLEKLNGRRPSEISRIRMHGVLEFKGMARESICVPRNSAPLKFDDAMKLRLKRRARNWSHRFHPRRPV